MKNLSAIGTEELIGRAVRTARQRGLSLFVLHSNEITRIIRKKRTASRAM